MLRRLIPLLAALSLAAPAGVRAQTTCSAQQQFRLDWNAQTQGPQGTAPKTYNATDGLSHTETVTVSYNGATAAFKPVAFGGTIGTVTTPYIGVVNTGGLAATEATLTLGTIFDGYATNIDSGTNVVGVRFVASKPLREISFTLLDIDYAANQFRDWIKITGQTATGATVVPRIANPYGNNNQTNPGQTAPSATAIGPITTVTPNLSNSEIVGNGAAGTAETLGNVTASFAVPVVRVDIRYGNGPAAFNTGTAGQQAIGIHDLLFCTVPVIDLAKTSASVITTGSERFDTPGSDVDYTLTLTNTGGSAVDVNSTLIADVLPAGVTFFNGDIDPATAGVQTAVLVGPGSGLTLANGNVSASNNGGASYAYTPAAGYDPAVTAVRFQPQGQLAAYSSATIRFRVRIK